MAFRVQGGYELRNIIIPFLNARRGGFNIWLRHYKSNSAWKERCVISSYKVSEFDFSAL